MKRRYITGIIILLFISLVGIVVLQGIWIHNAWRSRVENFNHDVHDALNNVVVRLERQEAATFISHNYAVQTSDGFYFKPNSQTYFNNLPEAIIRKGENDESVVVTQYSQNGIITDSLNKRMVIKSDQLNEIIHQMVMEWSSLNIPVTQRINSKVLYAAIKQELESRNINLPFEFAIIIGAHHQLCDVKSGGFKADLIPVSFHTNLFPNDIIFKSDQLLLHFDNVRPYFVRSLWWMLMLSVLFTMIIIGTFGSAIYIILKQKKVSEIKTDFINNMTHEFKTPISTISLALDAIHNPKVFDDKGRVRYYTDIISSENKRMNAQVENILQMALLDKENYELNHQLLDIHELIERVVEPVRLQVEKRNGKLELFLGAENPFVLGDEVHLTNVIYNLLDNANKYSRDCPDISVSTENTNSGVVISIQDKGIGMNSEAQGRIFEKFYRAAKGNVHNVKGFGLGLAYVKGIVKKHGGSIKVHSEQGKGSRFDLYFPFGHQKNNHGEETTHTLS